MKVLLDNNMPDQLIHLLDQHHVSSTRAMGWDLLRNGQLLKAAEADGFEILITGDKKLVRQYTNLTHQIAIIIVGNQHREVLEANIDRLRQACAVATVGRVETLAMPGTTDFFKQQATHGK